MERISGYQLPGPQAPASCGPVAADLESKGNLTSVFISFTSFREANSDTFSSFVPSLRSYLLLSRVVPCSLWFATMVVGVLALQGSFNEHIAVLRRLGVKGVEIRKPEQLQSESVRALIIPGGESTTMAKLAEYHNLFPALRDFVKIGKPVWGTCAGLIFLADKAVGQKQGGQELIGGISCTVHRNFFGSQIQSFEAELSVPEIVAKEGGSPTFRGVFIRAPGILEVGPEVQVLAEVPASSHKPAKSNSADENLEDNAGSEKKVIVAVKQGNLLATAFHPELTADTRWHSYFLKMVNEPSQEASSSTLQYDPSLSEPPKYELPIFQQ